MEIEKKLRAYAREKKNAKIKEEKLQQTIIKANEEYWKSEEERNLSWIEFLYQQASYIQKRWWAAQGMILFILWLTLSMLESSNYIRRCMGIVAPSFVIMILPELWKNRNSGAMEIEGAAYFSLKKIYAARMLLFGMVDVCLLSIFLVVSNFTLQITFMDILIQFILPLNVTCCICFQSLCSKRSENVFSSLFLCLIWIAVWMLVVLSDNIYESISIPIWGGIIIFSAIYVCYSIWRVWKNSERYYENNSVIG